MEDARNDLRMNTIVSEDRRSGIVTIRTTDKDPQRAAAMAGEYVEELNRLVTTANTSSAHRERVFLEGRLDQVKKDLETAENNFSQFASKNAAIDIPAQGKAMIEAAAGMEGELVAAETELESLKQLYADGNVRVRSMQARVNELQRQIKKLGGKPSDKTAASDTSKDPSEYPSIRSLPLLGVSYADLYRNTKVQEAIFEALTRQYELAKVQEAKETPSVKIVDAPNLPEKKSFPHRAQITLFGGLVVFLFSFAWIFTRASWDDMDPQDPQKVLTLEVYRTFRERLRLASRNGAGVVAPGNGTAAVAHDALRDSISGNGR
jgi:capsule polysaccharide export protein KpsE/RkpR